VLYPGVYAIEEGTTKVGDLVRMAGGFTPEVSLPEAEMIRGYYMDVVDLEYERLKRMEIADMSKQEYEYFKTKSREKRGKISCDFVKLFQHNQKDQDILLKDGDLIRIPAKSLVVRVSGNVVNPGLVSFEAEEDYTVYIEKAGGYSWRASKGGVRVIKEVTGEWVKPGKSTRIDPGDTIWIPGKPDRDYWGFFKDTMMVLGNMATLYLVVREAVK
jgi:protein involved in polysaccharide export with SLBB domain